MIPASHVPAASFRPARWTDWACRDPHWQEPFLAGPYQGRPGDWARRLAWSAAPLDHPEFRQRHEAAWPGWWQALDWSCQLPATIQSAIQETPFAPCLAPLVACAIREFPDNLHPSLAIGLITELSAWSHRGFYAAFDAFRRHRRETSASGDHFAAFTAAFTSGPPHHPGLIPQGLIRLLALLCVQWRDATRLVLTRLARDEPDACVLGLEASVADRHHGGQRVIILTLAGNWRIVYKARSVAPEAAFFQWLENWTALPAACRPSVLQVRPRHDENGAYGWMDFVEHSLKPEPHYHGKAGTLLFLMHLLGGSDLHMENVIASAAGPMLIDLECLLQPTITQSHSSDNLKSVTSGDDPSGTGLLPARSQNKDREWVDISGFGGSGGYQSPGGRRKYLCLHRGLMSYRQEPARAPMGLNQPGSPPWDHLIEIQQGYQAACDAIRSQPDTIQPLMETLAALPMRFLLRPTTEYGLVLRVLSEPACLTDPLIHAAACETLTAAWVNSAGPPPAWPALHQEHSDLDQYDIPVYHVLGGSRDLLKSGAVIVPAFFAESGYDAAVRRLSSLSGESCTAALKRIALRLTPPPAPPRAAPRLGNEAVPLQELVQEAVLDMARSILSRMEGQGHRLTWPEITLSKADPAGLSLYGGTLGTAVFLAAAGLCCGCRTSLETAHRLGQEAATALGTTPCTAIGGIVGQGSVLLGFNLLAKLTGDSAFHEIAHTQAHSVSSAKCQAGPELDLLGGLSGWIAALVDHSATQPPGACTSAITAAVEALLQRQTAGHWQSPGGRVLSGGLAHGAGGPALALSRAARLLDRPDWADAACGALVSEESGFDPTLANWPLAQGHGGRRTAMNAWCNGAAGLMAAAVEISAAHGKPDLTHEPWHTARTALLTGSPSGCDHVCCGNAGRLAMIQSAGASSAMLEPPARELIRRWQRERAFRLDEGAPPGHAGLFRGLAGLGWVLLRLAFPDKISDLLFLRSHL